VVYTSTDRMLCAVLIHVIFCSSMAKGWAWSNWRFWSNPFIIVPIAQIITGTVFVLIFHIMPTSNSRSLKLLSFSVCVVLMFKPSGMTISINRQVFSILPCSTLLVRFASIVWSVITGMSHVIVVSLIFMIFPGICSYYLPVTCNPVCLHIAQWM
jgi:hypothetical protein